MLQVHFDLLKVGTFQSVFIIQVEVLRTSIISKRINETIWLEQDCGGDAIICLIKC